MINKDLTSDFHNVLEYCENNKLYIGEGNPNAKILLIGKEIGFGIEKDKTPSLSKSDTENKDNLTYWRERYESNYLTGYLKDMKQCFKEKPNRTWANYQKIVDKIIGRTDTEKRYDFLDYSFITELNQIHLPYSNGNISEELKTARTNSVKQRKELFKKDFFQNFPIVIMACGHYPTKQFNFDIEAVFEVKWNKETVVLSRGNYYNLHSGKCKNGKNKILIHTRQVSLGVTNQLLSEVSDICKPYYN